MSDEVYSGTANLHMTPEMLARLQEPSQSDGEQGVDECAAPASPEPLPKKGFGLNAKLELQGPPSIEDVIAEAADKPGIYVFLATNDVRRAYGPLSLGVAEGVVREMAIQSASDLGDKSQGFIPNVVVKYGVLSEILVDNEFWKTLGYGMDSVSYNR